MITKTVTENRETLITDEPVNGWDKSHNQTTVVRVFGIKLMTIKRNYICDYDNRQFINNTANEVGFRNHRK